MTNSSKVANKLREKYGEEFIVDHDNTPYPFDYHNFQFSAYPVRLPDVTVVGWHGPDLSNFSDSYLQNYYSYLYSIKIKKYLEKYTSPCYVATNLMLDDSIYKCNKASVDTLNIENAIKRSHFLSVGFYVYFFDVLDEKTKGKLLTGVFDILNSYAKNKKGSIGFDIYFFDRSILKHYATDEISYNYRKHVGSLMDDKYCEFLKNRLNIDLDADKPFREFTIDTLYNLRKSITPTTFGIPIENLNDIK